MRITSIETIPVRVPIHPDRVINSAIARHDSSPFLLVKMRTDEDLVGLGEVSCTPFWSGEDQVTAAHVIRTYIEPALVGQDPTEVERLTRRMDSVLFGNPFTKAGVEMALWDLLGKAAGLPLYRLFGGSPKRVNTKFSVSGAPPDEAAKIAAWAVEQGFRAMKVKVGLVPEEDVARVRAVRKAIGPDVKLGVDANGGWSQATARQIIPRLEDFGIAFVEQPIAAGDVEALADVRGSTGLPIIADESVTTPGEAFALARAGAADVFSIYVGNGGIGPARATAAVARAAGLCCTVGSNLELGTAAAAMIHLAAATPGVDFENFPCDILTPFYYPTDLLSTPLDIHGGYAVPPEGPGLGVEWDEVAIGTYRV
jgi:muconate cycloisomerase